MTIRKIACLLLLGLTGVSLWAQTGRESIEIDYGNPKTYVVGGVGVEGNQYFGENQILQLTGLRVYEGVNGLFVSYPNDTSRPGEEYHQIYYPLTSELRAAIEKAILEEYKAMKVAE